MIPPPTRSTHVQSYFYRHVGFPSLDQLYTRSHGPTRLGHPLDACWRLASPWKVLRVMVLQSNYGTLLVIQGTRQIPSKRLATCFAVGRSLGSLDQQLKATSPTASEIGSDENILILAGCSFRICFTLDAMSLLALYGQTPVCT